MKIYNSVDLTNKVVQNVRLQTTEPNNPVTGTIYLDTGTNHIRYWNGTAWQSVGESSGGGGQENILEGIKLQVGSSPLTSLNVSSSKSISIGFSSTGSGDLKITDANLNQLLGTVNIGSGGGVSPSSFGAYGTLQSGHSNYLVTNPFGTNRVLVQVIDNAGLTVVCDVTRYESSGTYYIGVRFSENISSDYTIIVIGNLNFALLQTQIVS